MEKKTFRKEPYKIGEKPDFTWFKTHPYDLDVKRILSQIRENMHSVEVSQSIEKNEYISSWEYILKQYCLRLNISFKNNPALVIPSRDAFYIMALSFALIHYDPLKISAFLNYQSNIYKGKGDFADVIEHIVYEIVKKSSFFIDKEASLKNILSWVEDKREHLNIQPVNAAKKHTKKSKDKPKYSMPVLAYCLHYLSITEQLPTKDDKYFYDFAWAEGYRARTSWHRLKQNFSEYESQKARIFIKEGSKRSEHCRNQVFKDVLSYLIKKNITVKASEEFKADYKAFKNQKFLSNVDFIDLDSLSS